MFIDNVGTRISKAHLWAKEVALIKERRVFQSSAYINN